MPDSERELRAAVRRYNALKDAEARRDEAIRAAIADGIAPSRVVEITGMTRQRISQIRHRVRTQRAQRNVARERQAR